LFISMIFFFSSRRRHTRFSRDWSSDVCSSDLYFIPIATPTGYRTISGWTFPSTSRGTTRSANWRMPLGHWACITCWGGAILILFILIRPMVYFRGISYPFLPARSHLSPITLDFEENEDSECYSFSFWTPAASLLEL